MAPVNWVTSENDLPANIKARRFYFSDPVVPLLHLFLTIPAYQMHYQKLPELLGISKNYFSTLLTELESYEFIRWVDDSPVAEDVNVHLDRDDQAFEIYHRLRALRTLERELRHDDQALRFSAYFTSEDEIVDEARIEIMKVVKNLQEKSLASKGSKVYQIDTAILNWSE